MHARVKTRERGAGSLHLAWATGATTLKGSTWETDDRDILHSTRYEYTTSIIPGMRDMPSKILHQYYDTIRWSIYTGRGLDALTDTGTA